MIAKTVTLGSILCLVFAQPANQEKAKKDLERMQGTWIMHALEVDGKDVGEKRVQDSFLIVKKDVYVTKVKDKEQPGFRIVLDPSKEPKTIDMIKAMPGGAEEVYKGIYTFENDTLKICRGLTAQQERPQQFATWPNTSVFLVTWKKK